MVRVKVGLRLGVELENEGCGYILRVMSSGPHLLMSKQERVYICNVRHVGVALPAPHTNIYESTHVHYSTKKELLRKRRIDEHDNPYPLPVAEGRK